MANVETEEALRALAELDEKAARPVAVDTEVLAAYRRDELSGEARASIESLLAGDPQARAALAAGAGVPTVPSPSVRAAVLAEVTAPKRRIRPWWGLVIAALFVGALFAVQLLVRPDGPLPEIELMLTANTEVRSVSGAPSAASNRFAGPADTPLKLTYRPTLDAEPDIEVGLYCRWGDAAVRVDKEPWVTDDGEDGSGTFMIASAGDLVGDRAGTTTVWLVVAWRGELPNRISLPADADDAQVAALLADGDRRDPTPAYIEIVSDRR